MSKVSVIIPFYNCPYIDQAINSVLQQTYGNVEIIVVNDGATEHTEKINPFLSKITYLQKENGGTASALNTGIKKATGDYFCWLSSDDLLLPEKIETQLLLMKNSRSSISYTNYYSINEDNKITSLPLGTHLPSRYHFVRLLKRGNFVNGCTVMMNMNVFQEIGYFDETLPYTHDYDFWLRAAVHYHFSYVDNPLLLYRVHSNMGSKRYAAVIKEETRMVSSRHRPAMDQLLLSMRNR